MINEALLEMYYFAALRDYFIARFGATNLRLLKPSTSKEVWVGFDQGWAVSELSEDDLFDDLRASAQNDSLRAPRLYIGYFLQFKLVKKRERRSRNTPSSIFTEYLQIDLDLAPSKTTGLSQHRTLRQLSRAPNVRAAYALPLIFSLDEVYKPADLSSLWCVPIEQAPNGWSDGEEHRLVAQEAKDPILWCSDPIRGTWSSFSDWAATLEPITGGQAQHLVEFTKDVVREHQPGQATKDIEVQLLPQSLTLVEISR